MKDSHHGIKARYRLLLFVLLISIMAVFFTLYNQSHLAISRGMLFLALFFTVVALGAGVIIYYVLLEVMGKLSENDDKVRILEKEVYNYKAKEVIENQKMLEVDETEDSREEEDIVLRILSMDETSKVDVFLEQLLVRMSREFEIVQAVAHIKMPDNHFHMVATYAFYSETEVESFIEGETIAGQTAKNKEILHLQNIPEGYLSVLSGLGKGNPSHLLIIPIVYEDDTIAIIELASFVSFDEFGIKVFEKLRVLLAEYMVKLKSSLE